MNMQALMKQAQKMQQDVMNKKNEINNMNFEGESSLVKVCVNGKKEILKIEIKKENNIEKEDIEMLEDMLIIALNSALKKVDDETEKKLGNMAPGLSGLI